MFSSEESGSGVTRFVAVSQAAGVVLVVSVSVALSCIGSA